MGRLDRRWAFKALSRHYEQCKRFNDCALQPLNRHGADVYMMRVRATASATHGATASSFPVTPFQASKLKIKERATYKSPIRAHSSSILAAFAGL